MATRAAQPAPAVAAQLPPLNGGVNLRDSITQLAENQARRMQNGVLDEAGGFAKRLGVKDKGTFGAGADRVLSSYTFYRDPATPHLIIHTTGGKIYYTADPSADPIVWTQMATGKSISVPMSYETFNGKCYMANGVDDYASWDGTTYTTFASAPKGKYLRLWKDAMWVSGISGTPDRVYESNAGDAETFGVSSWVDIAKGDGDSVRALATDGQVLIVGKRNRGFSIYDPVSFANRVVDFEKGFESHFAVVPFEGNLYFLSRRGVFQWFGDSPSRLVSSLLDPLFDPTVLALNKLDVSTAYTIGNRIGFSVPEVGTSVTYLQIEYYPRLGPLTAFGSRLIGPWTFQRMPVTAPATYRSGATERLFAGYNDGNKVGEMYATVGTDFGIMFSAVLETGGFDFKEPTRTKYIRRMRTLGRGKFILQIKRDYDRGTYKTFPVDFDTTTDIWDPTNDVWNVGTWGPDVIIKEVVLNPDAYGTVFQFRMTDAETDTGRKLIDVGDNELLVTSGEWAIYNVLMEGNIMGIRS